MKITKLDFAKPPSWEFHEIPIGKFFVMSGNPLYLKISKYEAFNFETLERMEFSAFPSDIPLYIVDDNVEIIYKCPV